MIERYEGENGHAVLIEALLKQQLVGQNRERAEAFARVAKLEELPCGAEFIQQGGADNDLYLILSGAADVVVNGRVVAERSTGMHVGEMSIIDPTARRCASVVATTDIAVARVAEADFVAIASSHPAIWRILGVEVCNHLRQRSQFVLEPNPRPVVFVGSSRESLPVAELVNRRLNGEVETALWTRDIFQPSSFPIEDLGREVRRADFAVLVFGPDDVVISRGAENPAPRDNVVLELGMFLGALTRQRTFIVQPRDIDLKIPADLMGLTPLEYTLEPEEALTETMTRVTETLLRIVKEKGVK